MFDFFFLGLEATLVTFFLACKGYAGPANCFFGRFIRSAVTATKREVEETGGQVGIEAEV